MSILHKILGRELAKLYIHLGGKVDCINDLFVAREKTQKGSYSDSTKANYISRLHRKGIIDIDGNFTKGFYDILNNEAIKVKGSRRRISRYITEADIRDTIYVDDNMEIKDVFNILEKNPSIAFLYPPKNKIGDIDFNYTKVQYVRLNNLSHYVRYPEYIKYISICPKCNQEIEIPINKPVKCTECKVNTKIDYTLSQSRSCFVYMIDYQHEQYVARCLDILPLGDFNAAVVIVKDKSAYTMFIVCTSKPDKPKLGLKFDDRDRISQLTEHIDKICLSRIGKQIYGMTYYKYAIILSQLASLAKMTNYNIYIIGAGGLGKTSTAKLYCAVITEKTKCQDATNISGGSGIRGSTQTITIGGRIYSVHEPGILERYNIVVLDEILDMGGDNSDKSFLKSSLSSSTLTTEVAGNRTEITKNATVIGTSNIPRRVKVLKSKYLVSGLNPEIEFSTMGQWYVDGQNIHFLDRFALLFYLDESEARPDFNINDQKISDIEMRQTLYAPEIDNYLKLCSQISVYLPDDIIKELERLSSTIYDPIHSTSRRDSYISMTTQLHAMINGRDMANMDDVLFTKQMLRKCFHPITVNMLSEKYEDITQNLDIWALKTNLAKLKLASKEQLRKECSRKYSVFNFDNVFEHAIHYNEIIGVKGNKYRCTGAFG